MLCGEARDGHSAPGHVESHEPGHRRGRSCDSCARRLCRLAPKPGRNQAHPIGKGLSIEVGSYCWHQWLVRLHPLEPIDLLGVDPPMLAMLLRVRSTRAYSSFVHVGLEGPLVWLGGFAGDHFPDVDVEVELFEDLSTQRLLGLFAGPDFATGQLPAAGKAHLWPSLCHEARVLTDDRRADHVNISGFLQRGIPTSSYY